MPKWEKNVLVCCDLSGSMFTGDGLASQVAISLTLTCMHMCKGRFGKMFIPFSKTARLVEVQGNTLRAQLECIMKNAEVANTDFTQVYELLISNYKMWNVPKESQVDRIYVLTDEQFDSITSNSSHTHIEHMEMRFKQEGFKFPEVVFWCVKPNTVTFAAPNNKKGVALVSGYSADLMRLFVDGEDLSPYGIFRKAIDDSRYDRIQLAEEKN